MRTPQGDEGKMKAVQGMRRCAGRPNLLGLHFDLDVVARANEVSPRCHASRSAARVCCTGPKMPAKVNGATWSSCTANRSLRPLGKYAARGDRANTGSQQRVCLEGAGRGGPWGGR